ncbi:MAG: hypothetical protein QGI31_01970 [Dehalococcoidia bacterium]|jgi:hypothetical protein|nr:hypothetical protein [Dehalococcoidia bacterium]|tara:strand:+ start:3425 stop:3748 length:324 start_codon:yes stop_codon:yes gene_type:complete
MIRSRTVILPIVVLIAVIFSIVASSRLGNNLKTVTGQVLIVEQSSITTVSSLTLEDDSGKQWTFEGGGVFSGFTPAHLLEHRALGEPVTVEYEETGSGILRIVHLAD